MGAQLNHSFLGINQINQIYETEIWIDWLMKWMFNGALINLIYNNSTSVMAEVWLSSIWFSWLDSFQFAVPVWRENWNWWINNNQLIKLRAQQTWLFWLAGWIVDFFNCCLVGLINELIKLRIVWLRPDWLLISYELIRAPLKFWFHCLIQPFID